MRAILTYHSIDPSGSPISVAPEAFDGHLAWLTSGRVQVLPLADLAGEPAHGPDAVALTFDDGFANFATQAWPRLRAHGLPVTMFVVTAHVGRTNAWGGRAAAGIPDLPLMTWDVLGRCREEGLEVAAHTRTHPRLSSLGQAMAEDEIAGSAADLQARLGLTPTAFAYPYGDAPALARRIAGAAYRWSCTTEYRPLAAGDAAEALPRLDMCYFSRADALAGWGGAGFRTRLAARRALRRLGAALRAAKGTR